MSCVLPGHVDACAYGENPTKKGHIRKWLRTIICVYVNEFSTCRDPLSRQIRHRLWAVVNTAIYTTG